MYVMYVINYVTQINIQYFRYINIRTYCIYPSIHTIHSIHTHPVGKIHGFGYSEGASGR